MLEKAQFPQAKDLFCLEAVARLVGLYKIVMPIGFKIQLLVPVTCDCFVNS